MKKKILVFVATLLGFILVSAAGLYCLAANLYSKTFSYNTYINGIYCTGKTPDEVNSLLSNAYDAKDIEIISEYGCETIRLSDIYFKVDYTRALSEVFLQRSGLNWGKGLFETKKVYEIKPDITYSQDRLEEQVYNTVLYQAYVLIPDSKVSIIPGSTGYNLEIINNEMLDVDKLIELCNASIQSGNVIDVSKNELIYTPSYTEDMLETLKMWDDISTYLSMKITYDMGDEQIVLSSEELESFLMKSDDVLPFDVTGKLLFDEAAVFSYVDRLCDRYDTYERARTFVTHTGAVKIFEGNNHYGTTINREAEKEYLLKTLLAGEDVTHIPSYSVKPFHRGLNDIGNEFIEIDLTKQMLYYIKDNEVVLESKVVTGKPSQETPTPEMVCYVYKKSEDTYLKGTDYYNHVDYWMAIYKKIGLHDASWQRSFGGTRYIKHGSHGCVNMPLKKAEELYGLLSIGTPVIVYK